MAIPRALIDSSLFIEHLRSRDSSQSRLAQLHPGRFRLATSSIVAAEVYYGARTPEQRSRVQDLLKPVQVLAFTSRMAERFSLEVQSLTQKSALIGLRDLAIACTALEKEMPLATLNRREFERVEGLELIDLSALV